MLLVRFLLFYFWFSTIALVELFNSFHDLSSGANHDCRSPTNLRYPLPSSDKSPTMTETRF
jgi:hypothetical protein